MNAVTPSTGISYSAYPATTEGNNTDTTTNSGDQNTRIADGSGGPGGGAKVGGGGTRSLAPVILPTGGALTRVSASTLTSTQFNRLRQVMTVGQNFKDYSKFESNGVFITATNPKTGDIKAVGFASGVNTIEFARQLYNKTADSSAPNSQKWFGNYTHGDLRSMLTSVNEFNNSTDEVRQRSFDPAKKKIEKFEDAAIKLKNDALKFEQSQPGPEWQKFVGKKYGVFQNPVTKETVEKAATQQLNKIEERSSPPVSRSCQLRSSASAVTNPGLTDITQTNSATVRAVVSQVVPDGKGGITTIEVNDPKAITFVNQERRSVDETVKRTFSILSTATKLTQNESLIFTPQQIVDPVKTTKMLKFGQPSTIRSVTSEKPKSKDELIKGEVRFWVNEDGGSSSVESVKITPEKVEGGTTAITNRISQTENTGGCIYLDEKTGVPYKVKAVPVLKGVGSSAATNPTTHMDTLRNGVSNVLRSTQGVAPNRAGAVPVAEGQSSKFGRP